MAKREASRFLVRVLRSRYRDHRVELSQFKRHIRRGASVCDVGAHKGSFLFWLARWCSPGRAVAFEPQADLANELARVCAKFSLDNVVIERRAAHSTSGSKPFFIPDGRKAGASLLKPDMTSKAMDVEAITLDEYFRPTEDVAAIKIDVEGSELDVLSGAQRTIKRCMPLLIVECDRHLVSIDRMNDTFSFLRDLGYSASFVNKGRILPLSSFDPIKHQRDDVDGFWQKRGYSNNFIFMKEG